MAEFFSKILGNYTYYTFVYWNEFFIAFVVFMILSYKENRKKHYYLKLASSFALGMLLCVLLSVLRTHFNNIGIKILTNSLISVYMFFTYLYLCDECISEICMSFSIVYASKGVSGNVFALILNMFGIDDLKSNSFFETDSLILPWLIQILIELAIVFGIYFLTRKRAKLVESKQNKIISIVFAITSLMLATVLYSFVNSVQKENFNLAVCTKILFVIIYIFIISLASGILKIFTTSTQLEITQQLLNAEKRNYVNMKDNIDLVNMKVHDIKRQLSTLQDKLTTEELNSLKQAVKIYDSNIKTGSDTLDMILTEKGLICDKNQIKMSTIADGSCLSFMSVSDQYALLSNAIENAIEAVSKLDDVEKRVVSLSIKKENENILIEETNYFNKELNHTENGKIETSKDNKSKHGFGIKSMEYIALQYNGKLTTSIENDIFFLTIEIPISKVQKSL